MEIFLQKCNLTETDQKVLKEKKSGVTLLLSASYEKLREKQIPEKIIQLVVTGRKALSLLPFLDQHKYKFLIATIP